MGKGGSSAPPPPDPVATANAQANANKQTAQYQAGLNMVDQKTPLGSLTYTMVSPGYGNTPPHYAANVNLTPEGQKAFDLSQQVSTALNNLALKGTGQAADALGHPFDTSNLPQVPSSLDTSGLPKVDLSSLPNAPSSLNLSGLGSLPSLDENARQNAEDAIYSQNTRYLNPQYDQAQTQLETKLINSGIPRGSAAWDQAMGNFNSQKEQAYSAARDAAVTGAADYANKLLSGALASRQQGVTEAQDQYTAENTARQNALAEALSARNQGLSEAQSQANQALAANQLGFQQSSYARELPINEVAALSGTGQVSMPTFTSTPQTSVAGTDITGPTYASYNAQLQNWQQQQQNQNSMFGNIFGGLASLGSAWIMSDERAKEDIVRIGETDTGIPMYRYRYKGDPTPHIGVMAQEVERVNPDAVSEFAGVKHVDYAQVA